MKSFSKRLFQKKMLIRICGMLDQFENIFCFHSVALDFLVNSQLSGELLKLLQGQFLDSHNQISMNLLPQIKFVRFLIAFREKVHFVHQRFNVLAYISVHYQGLLDLKGRRSVVLNLVRNQSLFFVNAVYTVELQTFFQSQNWGFRLICQIFHSSR